MARINRVRRARQQKGLTYSQRWYFLIGGPVDDVFESPEAERQAWLENRNELLSQTNPCARPFGWWRFESPGGKLEKEQDWQALERLGRLTLTERDTLALWKRRGIIGLARTVGAVPGGTR